ncbi:helix-turn-helix domain-containing protein [Streptomyces rhizosphaericus]|uniref:Helix-turn-helix transcriptional regulator n=1 Tax=Streptomyces rhizosphaericus TaxID=114699 RepID=A0A6G4ANF1_9ACTN|nr:helix-turn-helix transcriptional regulator [Streptomyces rhizosphaericus]MBI0375581.1 helix-turn-helix transcriptional regulator [Streptomyces albiflaviniger]NEW74141.1 helix-turn-helix transcriptional regulator [Streptomyces rhizosphaericus]
MASEPIPINRLARQAAGPDATQTAARIMLGRAVRDLRVQAKLTQVDVASKIHVSNSTISRLEDGKGKPEQRTLDGVMTFFKVGPQQRAELQAALVRAQEPEWFQHRYTDCAPGWFQRLLGLESMAISLQGYDARLVTGLLQTKEYAGAVIRTGLHLAEWGSDEERLRVELRLERQERVFGQPHPPHCIFYMDESVLRRRVDTDDVMLAQMQHLRAMADRPYITIRFVLLDRLIAGNAGTMHGSMTHLQFGRGGLPDLVYAEFYEDAKYYSRPDDPCIDDVTAGQSKPGPAKASDYERFLQLLLRIGGEACASPVESRIMIDDAIKRFSR